MKTTASSIATFHIIHRTGGVYDSFRGTIAEAIAEVERRNASDANGTTEIVSSFSSSIVAERFGDSWGVCGWRLHEIKGTAQAPVAVLTSQSATVSGKISRKEVCALNIRIVGRNGNLEKINPYFI